MFFICCYIFKVGGTKADSYLSWFQSAVVYLLLKFVVDWVDGQIVHLEAHETAVVVDFCMQLLQIYSAHNIGKVILFNFLILTCKSICFIHHNWEF